MDDYGRYTYVYILKNKSVVFDKFQEFVELTENLLEYSVKTLCSDNGSKYIAKSFLEYSKRKGIKKEYTIPYTPEQNGVAEHTNRKVMESVRSMLYHAHLPLQFRAKAVATAIYLRNRRPSSFLKDKKPFEAWFKEKT